MNIILSGETFEPLSKAEALAFLQVSPISACFQSVGRRLIPIWEGGDFFIVFFGKPHPYFLLLYSRRYFDRDIFGLQEMLFISENGVQFHPY
jgi:hypothetical protein